LQQGIFFVKLVRKNEIYSGGHVAIINEYSCVLRLFQ
jgi:hypothetical protein